MKPFFRALQSDLWRAFTSFGFWVGILGTCFVNYVICVLPFLQSPTYRSFIQHGFFSYSTFTIRIVLYAVAAVVYATSFCTDREHNFCRPMIQRIGKKGYPAVRVLSVFLSTFAAIFIGQCLYLLSLYFLYGCQMGGTIRENFQYGIFQLLEERPLTLIFVLTILRAAYHACYALVSLLISVWLPNVFIVLSSSIIVSYTYVNVQEGLRMYVPGAINMDLIQDGSFVLGNWWQSFLYGLGIILFYSAAIGTAFVFCAERRLKRA